MQESVRKHISQMSLEEVEFFTSFVRKKEWIMSGHIQQRMEERGGTLADILEVIGYGDLIEYHQRDGHSRLLFRGTRAIHKWVPCVVVELLSNRIITIYWNHVDDHHRTIKMDIYDEELDIIAMFKGEQEDEKLERRSPKRGASKDNRKSFKKSW